MSHQLTVKVMVIDVCPDVSWCVCGGSRWRSVWTWSNRCRTAPTRSWRPACRVSRGPTWRRDPSSRRPWVSASITRLAPRRSWSAYESHLLISFLSLSLSAARKNSRSRSWLSAWWRVPRCWGTTLYWGKSSLIIDRAIGFFSVLITLVCILIASDCLWLSPYKQEDAEAVWGDGGEVGPGAHPVRVPDRERRGGASLRARRGNLRHQLGAEHLPDTNYRAALSVSSRICSSFT